MNPKIKQADITNQTTDAIVNAANSSLMGGGGVDGAIHSAAGPKLKEECEQIREEEYPDGLPVGEAVITDGYNLDADYVIHTVGPRYSKDEDRDHKLKSAFEHSLQLAEENNLSSISFPAISAGAYGYPTGRVAEIARSVVEKFDFNNIETVVFCLFSQEDYEVSADKFNNKL
ncbi:MAG: O-acetyl-ADP-ribose deacetylase [Candidatus Paceibacteria bacterium]